ncbi:MAG: hypothetical protein PHS41_09625 [Victivallaceae bacterium]|nr:hypothetical protein [Victivallaceae bacterium]
MRHYEDFEMEHLKNRTGSLLLRLFCRLHLRRCRICRKRYAQILKGDQFLSEIRAQLTPLAKERKEFKNEVDPEK